ncbi:MAG: hypothetical protein E7Z69_07780 [Thermoplasmata archaeon]|nr:hypothetical protein [Thermoplasmata archaeon]
MKHPILFVLFITLTVVALTYYILKENIAGDFLVSITAVVGALAIWFELRRSKELAQGEFVVNLNNSFSKNDDIKALYRKLIDREPLTEEDRAGVVEYLTFFETVYILISREVVAIDIINDLFAFRFFTAVNNQDVRDMELVTDRIYYRNVYRLDSLWHKYRHSKGYTDDPVSDLEKAVPDYRKMIE